MASPDWVKLYRSFEGHLEKPYRISDIKLWFMLRAGYNGTDVGKVEVSYKDMGEAWGWKRKKLNRQVVYVTKIKRLLQQLEKEGYVCLSVSKPCPNVSQKISVFLPKYAELQGKGKSSMSQVCPKCVPSVSTLLGTSLHVLRKEKEKKDSTKRETVKKEIIKDPEHLRKILDKINLNQLEKDYPNLDVKAVLVDLKEEALHGNGRTKEVNWRNYSNWPGALRQWCKNAEKRGDRRRKHERFYKDYTYAT